MKVKIDEIVERVVVSRPGVRERVLTVTYTTEKGYVGTLEIAKEGMTEKSLLAVIKKDAAVVEVVLGIEKEV